MFLWKRAQTLHVPDDIGFVYLVPLWNTVYDWCHFTDNDYKSLLCEPDVSIASSIWAT